MTNICQICQKFQIQVHANSNECQSTIPGFLISKKCFHRFKLSFFFQEDQTMQRQSFFLLIEWESDVKFLREKHSTLKIIKSSQDHWNSLDNNKLFQIKIWYWQQNSTFVNFPWVRISRSKPISFTVRNTISWC